MDRLDLIAATGTLLAACDRVRVEKTGGDATPTLY